MNLKFWKKKDSLDLTKDSLGLPETPSFNQDFGFPDSNQQFQSFQQPLQQPMMDPLRDASPMREVNRFSPQPVPQQQNDSVQKDMELIIAKIDAIKSELDSIHQRVMKIEKVLDSGPWEPSMQKNIKRYASEY
ncbi:hypothetical protein C4573_06950 [Candidatus Woesearchaeota archaeon]|nr:MAG: hypothetical protein C4573_06950 [Candidatus Woesearchaeota archaeon]